jgi:hypothetical protein
MIRFYLPSEEELRAEVEREREMVVREKTERYGVEATLAEALVQNETLRKISSL